MLSLEDWRYKGIRLGGGRDVQGSARQCNCLRLQEKRVSGASTFNPEGTVRAGRKGDSPRFARVGKTGQMKRKEKWCRNTPWGGENSTVDEKAATKHELEAGE